MPRFRIEIASNGDELTTMKKAGVQIGDVRLAMIGAAVSSDQHAKMMVVIQLDAVTQDEALVDAQALYRRLRETAGLDFDDGCEPPVITPLGWSDPFVGSRAEDLFNSASRFAQTGLRARVDNQWEAFAINIATALELLAKAFLVSLNGALIADGKDFNSLLHASGYGQHARKSPFSMRTIGAVDALTRVGYFIPRLDNAKGSWADIFDVRNGVVHGGVHLPINDSLLVPFFSTCDDILRTLSVGSREAFWDDFLPLVDAHLRDYMEIAKIAAAEALATARSQFSHRYDSMSPTASREAIAAIERAYTVEKYLQSLTKCPACSYIALASGSYEVNWLADWEYEDDGPADDRGLLVTFSPGSLKCRVCDLRLAGKDELSAAGVPAAWQIEDADEADFRDDGPEWS